MHMEARPTLFHVSVSSGVPIYRQIMDQVHRLAAARRIKPGEFLPSVRQMASDLAINPMTVSKAYSLLERDGVIETARGLGVKLKSPDPEASLTLRKKALSPVLLEVVSQAYQLQLTPEQTLAELQKLFKEANRERRDHDDKSGH